MTLQPNAAPPAGLPVENAMNQQSVPPVAEMPESQDLPGMPEMPATAQSEGAPEDVITADAPQVDAVPGRMARAAAAVRSAYGRTREAWENLDPKYKAVVRAVGKGALSGMVKAAGVADQNNGKWELSNTGITAAAAAPRIALGRGAVGAVHGAFDAGIDHLAHKR